MKYIDEAKITRLIAGADNAGKKAVDTVLNKCLSLKKLTLEEAAILLAVRDPDILRKIFDTASKVKEMIYGKRVVLFAPLYISNICKNSCLYCAFHAGNAKIERKALTMDEIKDQVKWLLKRGHKRILLVAGEAAPGGWGKAVDYYKAAIDAIYSAEVGHNKIRRVNINCAPLSMDEFKILKSAGIGTYQLFQETYHEETYRHVHKKGPKSDFDNRIDAIERAFLAGIDDVGVGVLYGLYDYRFETLALLMHIEHLEEKFNVGPHTISVPRIEFAIGSDFSRNPPYKVSDEDFKKIIAVLRLSVPYTGIILSTRETAEMRDELFNLGVSQISAESRTSPGGYSTLDNNETMDTQFSICDQRSLDEVVRSLIEKKFIPSFCAACYRKERTGKTFMNLAKPGTIKGKCEINALITLKEYLDDFASDKVRREGYELIEEIKRRLDPSSRSQLSVFFEEVKKGVRDKYV